MLLTADLWTVADLLTALRFVCCRLDPTGNTNFELANKKHQLVHTSTNHVAQQVLKKRDDYDDADVDDEGGNVDDEDDNVVDDGHLEASGGGDFRAEAVDCSEDGGGH